MDPSIVASFLPAAEKYVIGNDRRGYLPILAAIEEYCAGHEVLIGNAGYLIGGQPDRSSYFIDVYAAYALSTAREIAYAVLNAHSPHIPSRTTSVRTVLKNEEFEIKVYDRLVCRVYSIKSDPGLNYIRLLGGVSRPGLFSDQSCKVIPGEIQLIELYHQLYSPANFANWPANLAAVAAIWGAGLDVGAATVAAIQGGGKGQRPGHNDVLALLGSPIVCGDLAIEALCGRRGGGRIAVLSAVPVAELASRLRRLGRVTPVKYPVRLPVDFQLTKHTLYIDRVPVADVYNSPEYELVPWREIKGIRVANPFVLARFALINLWIQRAIMRRGSLNTGLIAELAAGVDALRQHIAAAEPNSLFLDWQYEGSAVSPTVAKNVRRQAQGQFPTFYPAMTT